MGELILGQPLPRDAEGTVYNIVFRSNIPYQVIHLFLVGVPWGLLSVCPMVLILPSLWGLYFLLQFLIFL